MNINNKNEDLNDDYQYIVTEIKTADRKNWWVWGDDGDTFLGFENPIADNDGVFVDYKENPNVYYDGGAGNDTLSYEDTDEASVTVTASNVDGYDLRVQGGEGDADSWREFDELDVYVTNVEMIELTEKNDKVDLSGVTSNLGIVIDGDKGNDLMEGSAYSDHFIGGKGNDTLWGNDGDDVLVNEDGSATISGGAGEDVIYVTVDLESHNSSYVYGDWTYNETTGTYGPNGRYNEADVFVIGYDSGYSETVTDANFWDNFTTMGAQSLTGGLMSAGSMAMTGVGVGQYTSLAGYSAAMFMSNMAFSLISGATTVDATIEVEDNVDSQVFIEDFDPWSDTLVVALDEYADYVKADNNYTADGMQLDFQIDGTTFLNLASTDTEWLSVMENEDSLSISSSRMNDILVNTLLNSVKVWTDETGDVQAETLSGIDLLEGLTDAEIAEFATYVGEGSEGVWLMGNYGGGIVFGNGETGVAGTDGDDIIYAGTYDEASESTAFTVSEDIMMIGGAGDDMIFGSTSDGDMLFGGADDDTLYIVGGEQNEAHGGTGHDIASFAAITYEKNGAQVQVGKDEYGVKVDLSEDDTGGLEAVNAYYWDGSQTQGIAAYLYDIEGVAGTEKADILIGDSADNTLVGNGGDDVMTGGEGADTFVFTSSNGTDTITDFGSDDKLSFEALTASEYSTLIASLQSGGGSVDYGSGTIDLNGFDIGAFEVFTDENDNGSFDVDVWMETGSTGSSSGDSVICTYMNARGYIPNDVYQWDRVYGAKLGGTVLRGYHSWAVPLVRNVLERSEMATQMVRPLACAWAQEMAHRCDPVAHPEGDRLGRALLTYGVPVCGLIGRTLGALDGLRGGVNARGA